MIADIESHVSHDKPTSNLYEEQRQHSRTRYAQTRPPLSDAQLLNSERIAFTTPHRRTQWIATTHWFPISVGNRPPRWSRTRRIVPVRSDVGMSVNAIETSSPLAHMTGLTLLVSHVDVMLPSETYEPVLEALVQRIEDDAAHESAPLVEEIWIVEEAQAATMKRFIDFYLPLPSTAAELKAFGPQWPHACLPVQSSTKVGTRGRRMIGLALSTDAETTMSDQLEGVLVVNSDITNTRASDVETWNAGVRALYKRFGADAKQRHATSSSYSDSIKRQRSTTRDQHVVCGTKWRYTLYCDCGGAADNEEHARTVASPAGCTEACPRCEEDRMVVTRTFMVQQEPKLIGNRLAEILLKRIGIRPDIDAQQQHVALLFQARL